MSDPAQLMRMKVGFIGIGAQKCATSWLHDVLTTHPEVATSEPKELNYFNANYERGANWYESRFQINAATKIAGEFSPNYFMSRDAAERAQIYNPTMRLIALVRDPVARAFSNHLHEIRKKHIPEDTSFNAAMDVNPAYVQQSQYKTNIERWLDYFPQEQLLVLFSEDIADDPEGAFARIAAHLDISNEIDKDTVHGRSHESIAVKSEQLQNTLRLGGSLARRAGLGSTVARIKSAPGVSALLKANKKDLRTQVPDMTDATRDQLQELFIPDMQFISELTGRKPLPWKAWDNTLGYTDTRSTQQGRAR